MKVTCTQENFKSAIYNTERVVGKQSTLPILENILIETEKGMLKISATNLEIGVFLKIGAKTEKEGKITVPAKLISSFVNNLPPGENIHIETEGQLLRIKSGNYKANIKGLGAQDFPIIPEFGGSFLFSFSGAELKDVLPKILACVSLDSARPELGGVNAVFNEKGVSLASTDSFRLLEIKVGLKKEENYAAFMSKTNSIIIPSSTLTEVLRSINQEDKEVYVAIEENQIFFQIDNVRIVSRLINGKYPEYKQIIPKDFSTRSFVEKEDISRAVKMASFFTNGKLGEISFKLDAKEKSLEVLAESEEKGENRVKLEIEIEGIDQEIVFNPRYVADGINAIGTPRVAFLANSGTSPVVLRSVSEKDGKNEIEERLTYVVMPIKN